jgi:hypothetical protein
MTIFGNSAFGEKQSTRRFARTQSGIQISCWIPRSPRPLRHASPRKSAFGQLAIRQSLPIATGFASQIGESPTYSLKDPSHSNYSVNRLMPVTSNNCKAGGVKATLPLHCFAEIRVGTVTFHTLPDEIPEYAGRYGQSLASDPSIAMSTLRCLINEAAGGVRKENGTSGRNVTAVSRPRRFRMFGYTSLVETVLARASHASAAVF